MVLKCFKFLVKPLMHSGPSSGKTERRYRPVASKLPQTDAPFLVFVLPNFPFFCFSNFVSHSNFENFPASKFLHKFTFICKLYLQFYFDFFCFSGFVSKYHLYFSIWKKKSEFCNDHLFWGNAFFLPVQLSFWNFKFSTKRTFSLVSFWTLYCSCSFERKLRQQTDCH